MATSKRSWHPIDSNEPQIGLKPLLNLQRCPHWAKVRRTQSEQSSLYPTKRTSIKGASNSLMGHKRIPPIAWTKQPAELTFS